MDSRVRIGCVAVLLVICLSLVGCAQSEPASSEAEPVQVQAIKGTDLNRVTVTEEASRNLGIQTEPVREATPTAFARSTRPATTTTTTSVPMTAVIYDPQGLPWVYTTPAARTFVRTQIVIDHTTSDTAYLSSGPPVGTTVVTVGVSELLGAEYGVGGE